MAPPDLREAGDLEWSTIGGLNAGDPIVSGLRTDYGGVDPDFRTSRIVTTPAGQQGPATDSVGVMAPGDQLPGVQLLDSWRDLLNFRGSPMPWLLLLALLFLGFMQLRVSARARAGRASAGASAAIG